MPSQPFTATILGSPRIGPHRELKRAIEGYWAGQITRAELESVAADLRRETWAALSVAGLDSIPVNTFSFYDQMLDTAVAGGRTAAPRRRHRRRSRPLLRGGARHRRRRAAGDDEVVRHQLSLHRPGDRPATPRSR